MNSSQMLKRSANAATLVEQPQQQQQNAKKSKHDEKSLQKLLKKGKSITANMESIDAKKEKQDTGLPITLPAGHLGSGMTTLMGQAMESIDAKKDKKDTRLPVTLLSGFLGSGKTTLMQYILNSEHHDMKIAVIVNDMSTLNIDAALIEKHSVAESREKLVKFQNGCICCTLRGDLLEELMGLAREGEIQYVLIESTGVSEPEQVAETFTVELAQALMAAGPDGETIIDEENKKMLEELEEMGGLQAIAYLDTCVTVVDAANVLNDLNTSDMVEDRWGADDNNGEEADRTVSDLLVDQIEFANVILLNKIDQVDDATKARVRNFCKALNPNAKVIETTYSKVEISDVINTGLYDYEMAKTGTGWLKSIHELTLRDVNGKKRMVPKPETEEYGISSFVYQARRPFHPKRLYALIHDKFVFLQNVEKYAEDGEEEEDDESEEEEESDEEAKDEKSDEASDDDAVSASSDASPSSDAASSRRSSETQATEIDNLDEIDDTMQANPEQIIRNRKAHPVLSKLYRSKGFFWHATRPYQMGAWSQAGSILTVEGHGPWFSALDECDWPPFPEIQESIRADFEGPWGDRRQELVMISEALDKEALTKIFDACLLNDSEMKAWEKVMRHAVDTPSVTTAMVMSELCDIFEDGWLDWDSSPVEPEGDHEGHHH